MGRPRVVDGRVGGVWIRSPMTLALESPGEHVLAREEEVADGADRVQVAARVDRVGPRHRLGRHVVRRADHHAVWP